MRIRIRTTVRASFREVLENFNESLFKQLNPPFPLVNLQRFDGSKTGDLVQLQLDFILFKQDWHSRIIAHHEAADRYEFIDIGDKLPFFLKSWKHRHVIEGHASGCDVIDDIQYSTGLLLFDWVMWPAMFLQFLYRKPIYGRVFS